MSQFPFAAIVGADDMALALVLTTVSPEVGGVLVRGEKGTAKSTIVRALAEVLPDVEVVARGLSVDEIAIAMAGEDTALPARLQVAQAELESDGTLQRLRRKWLGNPFVDQAAAVH